MVSKRRTHASSEGEGSGSHDTGPVSCGFKQRGRQLVNLYRGSNLRKRRPAYDGRKSLYTAGPLPFVSKEFRITLLDKEEWPGGQRREREFKVVIKLAARADLHHLRLFLEGEQADAPQEALKVVDIVLRELPTSRYTPVGRSFHSPDIGRKQSLVDGLVSWHGFYQSMRPTQMGLSLNADMSSTVPIEALPVVTFVCELLNPLSDADRVEIKKALRGVKVEVTHQNFHISGLTAVGTRELTFPVDGRNTQIGNSDRPNYLAMEVCKIFEDQKYLKKLNERLITALLKVTWQRRPKERGRNIIDTVRHHNEYSGDLYAKEFGIKKSATRASVLARILPPPLLKYQDFGREGTCLPLWNMMDKDRVCWDFQLSRPTPCRNGRVLVGMANKKRNNPNVAALEKLLSRSEQQLGLDDCSKHLGIQMRISIQGTNPHENSIKCHLEGSEVKVEKDNMILCWRSNHITTPPVPEITLAANHQENVGVVRNQLKHMICWAFVANDLVSSELKKKGTDTNFLTLSVRELCFYAAPHLRVAHSKGHRCHMHTIYHGLRYIERHGVFPEEDSKFSCIDDRPNLGKMRDMNVPKYKIKDIEVPGSDMNAVYEALVNHALGADVAVFSPEYYDDTSKTEDSIYFGPTSNASVFLGFHSVVVTSVKMVDGEPVFKCKSSHGTKYHFNGYLNVSGSTFVMGVNFAKNAGFASPGLMRADVKRVDDLPLSSPVRLIGNFMYPVLPTGSEPPPRRSSQKRKRSGDGKRWGRRYMSRFK